MINNYHLIHSMHSRDKNIINIIHTNKLNSKHYKKLNLLNLSASEIPIKIIITNLKHINIKEVKYVKKIKLILNLKINKFKNKLKILSINSEKDNKIAKPMIKWSLEEASASISLSFSNFKKRKSLTQKRVISSNKLQEAFWLGSFYCIQS